MSRFYFISSINGCYNHWHFLRQITNYLNKTCWMFHFNLQYLLLFERWLKIWNLIRMITSLFSCVIKSNSSCCYLCILNIKRKLSIHLLSFLDKIILLLHLILCLLELNTLLRYFVLQIKLLIRLMIYLNLFSSR